MTQYQNLTPPSFDYSRPHRGVNGNPEYLNDDEIASLAVQNENAILNLSSHRLLQIRQERNDRLSSCDWTQLPDAPLSDADKINWANYRQALRDLLQNITDPTNVSWPTPPANS